MIRAVVLLSLIALAAPALAQSRPPIEPADTGRASNSALGSPSGGASSSGPSRKTMAPTTPTAPLQQPPAGSTSQPSEACKKFPNLC